MKTKTFLFIGLCFFSFQLSAQWLKQNSGITGNYKEIFNISVVDENIAWASVWEKDSITNKTKPNQEYTYTINGGNTWTTGSILNETDKKIANIIGMTKDLAWIALTNNSTGAGKIYRTTDGGLNWLNQGAGLFNGGWLDFVHFFDQSNGVAVGDPNGGYYEIYTTTNGGSNWTRVPQASIPAYTSGSYSNYNSYYAINDTIRFITNKGEIYKSINKGYNWTKTIVNTSLGALTFTDGLNGISLGATNKFTINGGINWVDLKIKSGRFSATYFTSFVGTKESDKCPGFIISGYNGGTNYHYSSLTFDNGSNWFILDTLYHTSFGFLNSKTGWTGACKTTPITAGIYKFAPAFVNKLLLNYSSFTLYRGGASLLLIANIVPDSAIKPGIVWSSNNPAVAIVNNGYVTPINTGNAIITAKCGKITATCNITVIKKVTTFNLDVDALSCVVSTPLAIEAKADQSKLQVYPNPNSGIFSVKFKTMNPEKNVSIQVIDFFGKVVYAQKEIDVLDEYTTTINLSMFPKGLYMVRIINSNIQQVNKIIVY